MRLKARREFLQMNHHTQKFVGRLILLNVKKTETPHLKLGITVTRHFGNASLRNRFKRIVREAFRLTFPSFSLQANLLVRPRKKALGASMQEIQEELLSFLKQIDSDLQA